MPVRVFVVLGSNQDEPLQQLRRAVAALQQIAHTRLLGVSGIYKTRPMGPPEQDDYLNAVAELETDLAAMDLLMALQGIERQQGRRRDGERWHQRPLDLDILLYGDQVIVSDKLVVPHPGMHKRAFVLYPLQELDANISIPGKGPVAALMKKDLLGEVLTRLEESICP